MTVLSTKREPHREADARIAYAAAFNESPDGWRYVGVGLYRDHSNGAEGSRYMFEETDEHRGNVYRNLRRRSASTHSPVPSAVRS